MNYLINKKGGVSMRKQGRKPLPDPMDKKIPIAIAMSQRDIDFVDSCASELRISRSHFITNILMAGLDDTRLMKKTGFFKVVGRIRDLMENQPEQMNLPIVG